MNIAADKYLDAECGRTIIRYDMLLGRPAWQPENTQGDTSYEIGTVFQLDRNTCLLIAGLDEQGGACDCAAGADGFIFNDLPDIQADKAIRLSRPSKVQLPSGQDAFLLSYLGFGGFVPLGAVMKDGSPHPAAGTGFTIATLLLYSEDKAKYLSDQRALYEITDFKWDGKNLTFRSRYISNEECGGRQLSNVCLSSIAFEAGFMLPLCYTGDGICASYFEYDQSICGWRMAKIGPPFCADAVNESESSIVKHGLNYYIFSRSNDPGRLYVSGDGFKYSLFRQFDIGVTDPYSAPMILNQGLDGSLYIGTNLKNRIRNPVVAYPLLLPEGKLLEPVILHDEDGIREWGKPRMPMVDHPISKNILLAGKWKHIILYRVCDYRERGWLDPDWKEAMEYYAGYGPHRPKYDSSGLYAIEIEYENKSLIPWHFDSCGW
jgi:hypothetical protein